MLSNGANGGVFNLDINYTDPKQTIKYIDQVGARIDAVLPKITAKAADILVEELKKEIKRQGLVLTGDMLGSVAKTIMDKFELGRYDVGHCAYVVPYYSHYLEHGTKHHKAFKFASIAWDKAMPRILQMAYTEIYKAIHGFSPIGR